MIGWLVRAEIPLASLGRLDLPTQRIGYRNGFVRIGLDATKTTLICCLEDRDGTLIPLASALEARTEAVLMGHAVMDALQRYTKYEYEPPGDPSQVRVVVT